MMKFDKQLNTLSEQHLKIPARRIFHPRNFRLGEKFVGHFSDEYKRLIDEGHDEKKLYEKICKALRFHIKKR
jgi:hypothetical protein